MYDLSGIKGVENGKYSIYDLITIHIATFGHTYNFTANTMPEKQLASLIISALTSGKALTSEPVEEGIFI